MRRPLLGLTLCVVLSATATACATSPGTVPGAGGDRSVSCPVTEAPDGGPRDGVFLGVNVDWGSQRLDEYAGHLGSRPAVAVAFAGFPFTATDQRNIDGAVDQVRDGGGLLLLTLEPHDGLAAVTDEAADDLVARLARYNATGVPVVVRLAHEMNGSWYAWGQQPVEYVAAFRRVADAVHAGAPGSATMWAPNYGGGYPFVGGAHAASAATGATAADLAALDTDGDGAVTALDDPYAPYWPGADAVDWVGMSLYHWGDAHPWGENEVPEDGKFVAQLTGTYIGTGGDERRVPDLYGVYGERYGKPVAVPETAAFFAPDAGGADELAVKQAWWRQVLDPGLHDLLPRLAMINWFEWDKTEPEVGARVDWRAAGTPAVREAFRADLPPWARWADDAPGCSG